MLLLFYTLEWDKIALTYNYKISYQLCCTLHHDVVHTPLFLFINYMFILITYILEIELSRPSSASHCHNLSKILKIL